MFTLFFSALIQERALILALGFPRDPRDLERFTFDAAHAVRPAHRFQTIQAFFVGIKLAGYVYQVHGSLDEPDQVMAENFSRLMSAVKSFALIGLLRSQVSDTKDSGHPWRATAIRDATVDGTVFAVDAPSPKAYNVSLDPDRRPITGHGKPPEGMSFPTCQTMNPQPPHAETNQDTWPHHFYRLEFMRLDGNAIADHWKEWYPHLLDPVMPMKNVRPSADAPKFTDQWPFPIAYDSYKAAPNNYKLLYEDDHVRLIEVSIRPGETENMAGDPYPSVIANDDMAATTGEDHPLDPNSPLTEKGAGHGPTPQGLEAPTCETMGPLAPHAVHNTGTVPIHFYRIEFKRIDGDGLKTHWREWYPWMAKITDQYHEHPYASNYY